MEIAKYIHVKVIDTHHQGFSIQLELSSTIYLYSQMDPNTSSHHLTPSINVARRAITKAVQTALRDQPDFSEVNVSFKNLSLEPVAALKPYQPVMKRLSINPLIFSNPPVSNPQLFDPVSFHHAQVA